jgi:hypothetical protein
VRELIVHDEDDTRVVANTVEELLRYLAVAHASKYRVALEDIDIAGETIHAGDGIVQGYPFANWDTTAFTLLRRVPTVRLATTVDQLEFENDTRIRGLLTAGDLVMTPRDRAAR